MSQETEKGQYQKSYHKKLEDAIVDMRKRGEKGPASLRGHIVHAHFAPYILSWFGVAKFDMDLARELDIPLDWVVSSAYLRLEYGWPEDPSVFSRDPAGADEVYRRVGGEWNEDWCKAMVVKNLRYIEQLKLAEVDWDRIEGVFPGARIIDLDIERDSFDSFIEHKPVLVSLSVDTTSSLAKNNYSRILPFRENNFIKGMLSNKFI